METALIISGTEQGTSFLKEQLDKASLQEIAIKQTVADARMATSQKQYDLILINAPLQDETGEIFARQIASKGESQIIMMVRKECFDKVQEKNEPRGIMTVAKPISPSTFHTTLTLARTMHHRIRNIQAENQMLKASIEELKMINRAKLSLISQMGMSEPQAHHYLERQAMDMQMTKLEVARRIVMTYAG